MGELAVVGRIGGVLQMRQLSIGQAIEQEVRLVVRLLGRKAAAVKLVGGGVQIVR